MKGSMNLDEATAYSAPLQFMHLDQYGSISPHRVKKKSAAHGFAVESQESSFQIPIVGGFNPIESHWIPLNHIESS